MIRWAVPQDLQAAIKVMQAAKTGCGWYRYGTMDGAALLDIDDETGALRGYIRFHLGRPETHVRQLVVAPEHQGDGLVAKGLFAKLIQLAEGHGSQGLEGFMLEGDTGLIDQAERAGAQLDRGVRVRWPLGEAASERAQKLREALRA